MWCYWNYVTERYVGFIVRSSKSRKNPYASFARRIRDIAQNTAIKVKYHLQQELDLSDRRDELQRGRHFAECELLKLGSSLPSTCADPDISVLKPNIVGTVVPQVRNAVKNFILRSFDVSADEADGFLPEKVSQWGKITFLDGGDTIRAANLVQQSERNMTRDASFLKVILSFCTFSFFQHYSSTPTTSTRIKIIAECRSHSNAKLRTGNCCTSSIFPPTSHMRRLVTSSSP